MTISSNPSLNTNQLPISFDIGPEERDFQDHLLLYIRRIANAVNTKENGFYLIQETANFEQWFMYHTGTTTANPQRTRSAFRLTFDLVALNGGPIPNGTATNLTLTSSTQPPLIDGYLYPVHGFGGAIDSAGISYFLNDPSVYVRYVSSTNTIVIENDTGTALTWAVWSMNYLKN